MIMPVLSRNKSGSARSRKTQGNKSRQVSTSPCGTRQPHGSSPHLALLRGVIPARRCRSPVNCPPEVGPGVRIWLDPYEPYSASTSGGGFGVPRPCSGGELQSTAPRSPPEFTLPLFPVQPSNRNGASASGVRGKPDLMNKWISSSPVSDLQQLSRCCSGGHNESWVLFHVIFLSLTVQLCSEK